MDGACGPARSITAFLSTFTEVPDAAEPDVVVVGAGAAGLATAVFARRLGRSAVRLVDGASRPGAKILVSGGSRCNVTNAVVTERDYWGGRRTIIRRVLARLPVHRTIGFFDEIGVPLKEEPSGKLFPRSDRSRDVLDALLGAAQAVGVDLRPGVRVHQVVRERDAFRLETSRGAVTAAAVVLATGGLSLPKTGSDGAGLQMARALGHTVVPTTPALAPLVLHGAFNASVSGVALDVELSLRVDGRVRERIRGPLLWTHFGISGPAALDMSRHWLRARLEGREATVTANLTPGASFETIDAHWTTIGRSRPRGSVQHALAEQLPASLAAALVDHLQLNGETRLSDLTREVRRLLAHTTTALPLPVTDSRGYNYAEATAGGVALDEIDPVTMQSRICPGLFLAGEMLDVDGRLGGFNFQWAWASGRTAAEGLAAHMGAGA
jgi:predicted Rossmann fold flavoprotein